MSALLNNNSNNPSTNGTTPANTNPATDVTNTDPTTNGTNTSHNNNNNHDNIPIITTDYTVEQQEALIDSIISILSIPENKTMVSKNYANIINKNLEVKAYAKIVGKDWTYYIKNLEITIGRLTTDITNTNMAPIKNEESIDIDLGPTKVISRKHAIIKFNITKGRWELLLYGRNGCKINYKRFYKLDKSKTPLILPLSSGTVIDIGGTQMLFILPDKLPIINNVSLNHFLPKILNSIGPSNLRSLESNPSLNQLILDLIKNTNYYKTYYGNALTQPMINELNQTAANANANANATTNANQLTNNDPTSMTTTTTSSTDMNNYMAPSDPSLLNNDSNKISKPPHSYAIIITKAILSTDEGIISLSDIYKFVYKNYSYFRYTKTGWQNSIRHNLSLNKAFEKVPRKSNDPGKGMNWRISQDYLKDFLDNYYFNKPTKIRRGSSIAKQLRLHLSLNNKLPGQDSFYPMDGTPSSNANLNNTKSNNEKQTVSSCSSPSGSGPGSPNSQRSPTNITNPTSINSNPIAPISINDLKKDSLNPTNNALISFNNANPIQNTTNNNVIQNPTNTTTSTTVTHNHQMGLNNQISQQIPNPQGLGTIPVTLPTPITSTSNTATGTALDAGYLGDKPSISRDASTVWGMLGLNSLGNNNNNNNPNNNVMPNNMNTLPTGIPMNSNSISMPMQMQMGVPMSMPMPLPNTNNPNIQNAVHNNPNSNHLNPNVNLNVNRNANANPNLNMNMNMNMNINMNNQ